MQELVDSQGSFVAAIVLDPTSTYRTLSLSMLLVNTYITESRHVAS